MKRWYTKFIVDILVNLIGLIVMPSGCSVPGCKRRGGGHEFPREAQRRETWIQVIRQQCQKDKWEPKKYAVVCPSHFKEADYSCQGKIRCIDQSNLRLVGCFHETRLIGPTMCF